MFVTGTRHFSPFCGPDADWTDSGRQILPVAVSFPRPLVAVEQAVIDRLLVAEIDCFYALRQQVAHTRVSRPWGPGLLSVDLWRYPPRPRAQFADSPMLLHAHVHDSAGVLVGELVLWIKEGALII